jgi:hypothetical protein
MGFLLNSLKWFLFCLLALPAFACALQSDLPSDPPDGLNVAWFHDDCAPWDGAATSLYLGRERAKAVFHQDFPFLHVALYSNSLSFRTGGRLRFEILGNQGHARYCRDADACVNARAVSIEFSKVEENLLEGRIEVLFDGLPPIRGGFRAARMPFRALCG